eukprot:4237841-Pyramimonas_sp.AAC.1
METTRLVYTSSRAPHGLEWISWGLRTEVQGGNKGRDGTLLAFLGLPRYNPRSPTLYILKGHPNLVPCCCSATSLPPVCGSVTYSAKLKVTKAVPPQDHTLARSAS